MAPLPAAQSEACEVLTLHSLTWLVVASAVGLLMAVLLMAPGWGRILEPLTYGRWVTVHLDLNLYGWCSMPLIGLLFLLYLPRTRPSGWGVAAVGVWSGTLLLATVSWLSGHTSGKLFMEWSGASRVAVTFCMAFLALAIGASYRTRLREDADATSPGSREQPWLRRGKWALLALLALIPPLMYWSASPTLFPPINPDSGGATGGSLLGSTLAVILIFWAAPLILGLPRTARPAAFAPSAVVLAAHMIAFGFLDHGHHSHHEPMQIAALSSLVIWLPLLVRHYRRFTWPDRSAPWLASFCAWGAVLLATALTTFMPGVLERWKFTNALVGHSHLAMAGMVTSFNVLVLVIINRRSALAALFDSRPAFICWHAGLALHVSALLAAGSIESLHPGWLFRGHPALLACYALRLLGGSLMMLAAVSWCWRAHALRDGITRPRAVRDDLVRPPYSAEHQGARA